MGPLVSVIIPTFGKPSFLERCIDSVLAQTYDNIEIIVVDDNGLKTPSQHETSNVMSKYESNRNIKYICHEVNRNGSAARNTGVNNSKGEYIALLDDDDVFMPGKIERQVKHLSSLSDEYAFVYCSHDTFVGDTKVGEKHAKRNGSLLYETFLHEEEMASSGLLIRRAAWDVIGGFDESFRRHQDWEFVSRLASKYLIASDDFIGFSRFLERRNSAKNPERAWELRMHYLEKMEPLISTLTPKQQNTVNVYNKMDIILLYLKQHRYRDFLVQYFKANLGIGGLKFLVDRIILIIKNKRLYIK